MKRIAEIVIACLLVGLAMPTQAEETAKNPHPVMPLDEALKPASLWATQPGALVEANQPLGFRWISAAKETAESTRLGNTLFGLPVTQALLRIENEKIRHATILFYNRGDDGEITRQGVR